jgi:hypothetical protein
MAWTKLLTTAWIDARGAAKLLKTTEREIQLRIAAGAFVTREPTPNVT